MSASNVIVFDKRGTDFEITQQEYAGFKETTRAKITAYSLLPCACARHTDGSVTTSLCPVHADTDPCLTMARVTGRRRKGTIKRGVCTSCGHRAEG